MFQGLYDVGVGVSDMERALAFYRDDLGFTTLCFDHTGELPQLEPLTGRRDAAARVVLLENPRRGRVGTARIRLVQLLSPCGPAPLPSGMGWGEIGVAEVSLQVSGIHALTARLTERQGHPLAMPVSCPPREEGGRYSLMSYILDPDGGKVELIDFPGGSPAEPETYGVFHTAVGTASLARSAAFYQALGLTRPIWRMEGVIPEMTPWHGRRQAMKIVMLAGEGGGCLELVQQIPKTRDCRGRWGRLGPMDFSIQVTGLERAMRDMEARGVRFLGPPQVFRTPSGVWRYAYFAEPDGNYAALAEQQA